MAEPYSAVELNLIRDAIAAGVGAATDGAHNARMLATIAAIESQLAAATSARNELHAAFVAVQRNEGALLERAQRAERELAAERATTDAERARADELAMWKATAIQDLFDVSARADAAVSDWSAGFHGDPVRPSDWYARGLAAAGFKRAFDAAEHRVDLLAGQVGTLREALHQIVVHCDNNEEWFAPVSLIVARCERALSGTGPDVDTAIAAFTATKGTP